MKNKQYSCRFAIEKNQIWYISGAFKTWFVCLSVKQKYIDLSNVDLMSTVPLQLKYVT